MYKTSSFDMAMSRRSMPFHLVQPSVKSRQCWGAMARARPPHWKHVKGSAVQHLALFACWVPISPPSTTAFVRASESCCKMAASHPTPVCDRWFVTIAPCMRAASTRMSSSPKLVCTTDMAPHGDDCLVASDSDSHLLLHWRLPPRLPFLMNQQQVSISMGAR